MAAHDRGWAARLNRLLAHHEQAAAAIRFTIELLNGSARAAKASGNGHATVIAEAIALDSARVAKHAKAKPSKGHNKRSVVLARRHRSAQVLDAFDSKTPRPLAEVVQALGLPSGQHAGIAPLVNSGYLKKKRGGYVRTSKAYVVDKFAQAAEE